MLQYDQMLQFVNATLIYFIHNKIKLNKLARLKGVSSSNEKETTIIMTLKPFQNHLLLIFLFLAGSKNLVIFQSNLQNAAKKTTTTKGFLNIHFSSDTGI